jgi:hypothetical protein
MRQQRGQPFLQLAAFFDLASKPRIGKIEAMP